MKRVLFNNRNSWLVIAWSLIVLVSSIQLVFYKLTLDTTYPWISIIKFPMMNFFVGILLIFSWLLPGLQLSKKLGAFKKIGFFIFHSLLYGVLFSFLLFGLGSYKELGCYL